MAAWSSDVGAWRKYLLAVLIGSGSAGCGGEAADPPVPPIPAAPEVTRYLPEIVGATPFEDLDPDPAVIEVNLFAHYDQVELEAGTLTEVMAYNGGVPGPLLHGHVGDRVVVHFHNQLDEPTTVHWHGLRISDQMDGNPRIQDPVQPGESFTYEFPLPDAGTYWYHPHLNTIEQIERGLYGAIVVAERRTPRMSAERLLILDDVRLDDAGQLAPFSTTGHDIVHGRAGNVLLTNGRAEPLGGTIPAGAIERWRLVNSANARTMKLTLEGASFRVIGTDGGLLPVPYTAETLELPVGQRYDLEVRPDPAAAEVALISHVIANVDGQAQEVPVTVASYALEGAVEVDEPVYPTVELPALPTDTATQPIALGGHEENGQLVFTINGQPSSELEDLVFQQGVPVRLVVENEIGPYHPFHLHGQFFQVLSRDGVAVDEPGLKDTVLVNAFEQVEILSWFDNPGSWMYHCHIGSHAEYGMMGQMQVIP